MESKFFVKRRLPETSNQEFYIDIEEAAQLSGISIKKINLFYSKRYLTQDELLDLIRLYNPILYSSLTKLGFITYFNTFSKKIKYDK